MRTSSERIPVLAFIPLTLSVFSSAMAFTLIGGTAIGTVPILAFLPLLWRFGPVFAQTRRKSNCALDG